MNKRQIIALSIFFVLLCVGGVAYNTFGQKRVEKDENIQTFMPGIEISALYDDGEYLWTGTSDGIYLLNRDSGEIEKKLDADIKMIFSAQIAKTDDGIIWLGHDAGLSAFNSAFEEVQRFEAPDIPKGRVNTIYTDGESVWAGSQEGAAHLSKVDGKWEVDEILDKKSGLMEDVVEVIEKVGDEIWFGSYLGTKGGGIAIRSEKGFDYIAIDDGLPHRYINAILPLSEEKVLIGTGQMIYGGLCIAEKKNNEWKITNTWDQKDGLAGMKVRTLFLDSSGRLWVTSETEGLIILDSPDSLNSLPLEGTILTMDKGLSDDEVKCIIENEYCYWLGTKYGLSRYAKTVD